MGLTELREKRKQMFAEMEQRLRKMCPKEEDSIFYHHSSEDRIVLSHALFWVMSLQLKGRIRQEKYLLLLRQYQEEMLGAYLTEDEYFSELLRYCNILYDSLPFIVTGVHNISIDKDARKLAAITIVASGYGGDMEDDLAEELLDDMDFHHNKVKCRKIEQMLPQLNSMVESEIKAMGI